MARMRSPNYPSIGLSRAIEMAQTLWDKEKRTAVPYEVAAKALGYGAVSGPARTTLAALKKYGLLVEDKSGMVKLSELAIRILHSADPEEKTRAVRDAALYPPLFRELRQTHLEGSDTALRSHLITRLNFSEIGAKQFIESFRDTMAVSKLGEPGYSPAEKPEEGELMETTGSGTKELRSGPIPHKVRVFSWPLAKDVSAELRLMGEEIKSSHLELLAKYLELAKKAIAGEEQ